MGLEYSRYWRWRPFFLMICLLTSALRSSFDEGNSAPFRYACLSCNQRAECHWTTGNVTNHITSFRRIVNECWRIAVENRTFWRETSLILQFFVYVIRFCSFWEIQTWLYMYNQTAYEIISTFLYIIAVIVSTWHPISSLIQIMACDLFGAKLSFEPMLVYCELDPWEEISVKFESKCNNFYTCKWIWK